MTALTEDDHWFLAHVECEMLRWCVRLHKAVLSIEEALADDLDLTDPEHYAELLDAVAAWQAFPCLDWWR